MNKMKIFRNIVVLVILFLPSTHAVGQPYKGFSSVLVEEGKLAEISCVTNAGSQSEYFWRKGESLHNSTDIAFFISGLPTDKSGRFEVTEIGTLIVKKVTLDDEGKYICRVSSEESDCHGEVFVFVKAVLQDFQLTIENCEPDNSCVISTESKKQSSLTCKATNASPSMKLKWFNGSHEIKDNIEENSLTKGPSREISSTIRDVYKGRSPLTCQAVDFKTSNDDGMFVHVQFHTSAATADKSPGWIVTAILFIVGFVILLLIVIFIKVCPKLQHGKDVETPNSAERESLLTNLQTKDDELKRKSEEINTLNTNLQTMDDELKRKSEEINTLNKALLETQADKRVDESNVTSKDKEIQDKREQISKLEKSLETVTGKLLKTNEEHQKTATSQQLNLESKLLTQKDSLNKKDLEIQRLQSKLEHVEEQLTKIQNREQEISSKEGILSERETKIKGREFEMNSKESKLRDRETGVKEHENEMNSKEQTLTERETKVKRRDDIMNSTKSKLTEMENSLKKREDQLKLKDSSLREQANKIKKRENELNLKESTLAEREAKTKKQLLDFERKTRKLRLDLMASKDPIRINCKLIASRTGDNVRVATKEKCGQATLKARKKRWDFNPKDAKFHTIYQTSAEPKDVCQSIVDLVEIAIDGKNSCLIAHDVSGREHWTTMFGPGEGASDALVPYAITKIFKRSTELRALDYKVDITARFKTTSTESTISESVQDEQTVLELLKTHKGNIVQVDGITDHLVQFFITTETDQETLTGTLILATIGSIQMIKECFCSVEPTIQLTRYISEVTSDGRCRSVLLTHIHEDKGLETKDCLAMVKEISKTNKK